jgi:hypothetical protein
MNNEQESVFFKAMMTGLFVGIIDTLICLSYNIGYRGFTDYQPSMIINVSSLIFASNLLLLVIGIVYYGFVRLFGKGDFIFTIVFLLLTAFFIWKAETGHRFPDAKENNGWRGLLGGIILVLGLSASSLPFLVRNKKFEEWLL